MTFRNGPAGMCRRAIHRNHSLKINGPCSSRPAISEHVSTKVRDHFRNEAIDIFEIVARLLADWRAESDAGDAVHRTKRVIFGFGWDLDDEGDGESEGTWPIVWQSSVISVEVDGEASVIPRWGNERCPSLIGMMWPGQPKQTWSHSNNSTEMCSATCSNDDIQCIHNRIDKTVVCSTATPPRCVFHV